MTYDDNEKKNRKNAQQNQENNDRSKMGHSELGQHRDESISYGEKEDENMNNLSSGSQFERDSSEQQEKRDEEESSGSQDQNL